MQITDLRGELVQSLNNEYLEGFYFSVEEDECQTVASLTNSSIRDLVALDDSTTNLIVGYTVVQKKETADCNTYKIEVVKVGTGLELVVTNVATDEPFNKIDIGKPVQHKSHNEDHFDTINDCIADFDSTEAHSALLAEANRTCENQPAHLTCHLSNGSSWSVVLFIRPTSLKCRRNKAFPSTGEFFKTN